MPSNLAKNLNLCFTKMKKRPLLTVHAPPPLDHQQSPPTTTATSSSSTLVKNFNSLYDASDQAFFDSSSATASSSDLSTSDTDITAGDFATVFASQRFFFSSPVRSNSIVDQSISSSLSSSSSELHAPFKHTSVAVPTFSPDPYVDFRRSMQEMVVAREHHMEDESVKSNWEFMHELLLCYLALNPKSTHKFIIGAFSDLLVSLLPSPKDKDSEFIAGVCENFQCS